MGCCESLSKIETTPLLVESGSSLDKKSHVHQHPITSLTSSNLEESQNSDKRSYLNNPRTNDVQSTAPHTGVVQSYPRTNDVQSTFPRTDNVQSTIPHTDVQSTYPRTNDVQSTVPRTNDVQSTVPRTGVVQSYPRTNDVQSTVPRTGVVQSYPRTNDVQSTVPRTDVIQPTVPHTDVQSNYPRTNDVQSTVPHTDVIQPTYPRTNNVESTVPVSHSNDRLSAPSITQLSYFDECSSCSLQWYNGFIYNKAKGLDSLTEEWLIHQMEIEWSGESLSIHWEYVRNPVPISSNKDQGHEGWTIDDFKNQPEALASSLTASEVIAIRLYTGDGYKAINESCRAVNGLFAVTVFCANRGIAKLGRTKRLETPSVYYRGLKGRMRPGFCEAYLSGQGLVECFSISDSGLFSTTSDIAVATRGPFSGNLLFVISKDKVDNPDGFTDKNGYEYVCSPAPVTFLSQYPHESEYLWPTYTCFVPLVQSKRIGINVDDKEIYEFSAKYLWDTKYHCIGRWKDIVEDELQMHQTCMKLAAYGLGMRDASMSIPMLLVDGEIDEDLTVEQAVSVAFSVFDREGTGVIQLSTVEKLFKSFYLDFSSQNREEVNEIWNKVGAELHSLDRGDGIHYTEFKEHYCSKDYTKF